MVVYTYQWFQKLRLPCLHVRIGAVTVVFGGFSPEALSGRIIDSNSKVVITADEGVRGGRAVPLKKNIDEALTNPEYEKETSRGCGIQTHWRRCCLARTP